MITCGLTSAELCISSCLQDAAFLAYAALQGNELPEDLAALLDPFTPADLTTALQELHGKWSADVHLQDSWLTEHLAALLAPDEPATEVTDVDESEVLF